MNTKVGPYFGTKVSQICLATDFLSNATSLSLIGSQQETQWPDYQALVGSCDPHQIMKIQQEKLNSNGRCIGIPASLADAIRDTRSLHLLIGTS